MRLDAVASEGHTNGWRPRFGHTPRTLISQFSTLTTTNKPGPTRLPFLFPCVRVSSIVVVAVAVAIPSRRGSWESHHAPEEVRNCAVGVALPITARCPGKEPALQTPSARSRRPIGAPTTPQRDLALSPHALFLRYTSPVASYRASYVEGGEAKAAGDS